MACRLVAIAARQGRRRAEQPRPGSHSWEAAYFPSSTLGPTNAGLPGRITMSTPPMKLMAPVRHQYLVYADDHAAVYRAI